MKGLIATLIRILSGPATPQAVPVPEMPQEIPADIGVVTDNKMISEHFSKAEFSCNHCNKLHPSGVMPPLELLEILEDVRKHFGAPVVVNSGYRCPTHNANVGGAKASRHMKGDAADIMVSGVSPAKVYAYLDEKVGDAGGVGRYSGFTHVDVRGYKARW